MSIEMTEFARLRLFPRDRRLTAIQDCTADEFVRELNARTPERVIPGYAPFCVLHAHPVWDGLDHDRWFYFVHSYYAQPTDPRCIAATTDYPEPFASAVAKGNMIAVQFHPEKSQADGLRLLANFLRWRPEP